MIFEKANQHTIGSLGFRDECDKGRGTRSDIMIVPGRCSGRLDPDQGSGTSLNSNSSGMVITLLGVS